MPTSNEEYRRIALEAFTAIRERFPEIEMELNLTPANVDVSLEMEQQPGLSFPVYLNLQGDELHLNAGKHYWVEWFPCTNVEHTASYKNAVCGLLNGDYRIVESYRGNTCVRAELQSPTEQGWESEGAWGSLIPFLTLWWLPERKEILRNVAAGATTGHTTDSQP